MNRKIKFRMWYYAGMTYNEQDWKIDLEGNLYYLDTSDDSYHKVRKNFDYELMQFTGLKSKSGVDIYEGDIVQTYWGEKPKELLSKGVVQFDEEKLQWMIGKAPLYNIECEVVGNVRQNPELLK